MKELYVALEEVLDNYSKEVQDEVEKAAKETANETRDLLKSTSPKRSGDYAGGWGVASESIPGRRARYIVRNSKRPGLTHLLEHGHAIKGFLAKRTNRTRTDARPHIKPAEEFAQKLFPEKVERRLSK